MNESNLYMNDTFDNFSFDEINLDNKNHKNQLTFNDSKFIKNECEYKLKKSSQKLIEKQLIRNQKTKCFIKENVSAADINKDLPHRSKATNKSKTRSIKENGDTEPNLFQSPKRKKVFREENQKSGFESNKTGSILPDLIQSSGKLNRPNLEIEGNKAEGSKLENKLKFPEHIYRLSSWGLPESILEKYKSKKIERMFEWQVECLYNKKILNEMGNLIYSAPTSAGKTLVAEILALKTIFERNKKVIFILPFVSIVREKMYYFQDILESSGYRADGFMGSYNPPGGINSVHMAICTIEKANNLVNRFLEENRISELGAIIVDEMHLLGDPSRGYLLELLLTKLKYISARNENVQIQIIGMSATLPNLNDLAKWLEADLFTTSFRPVPLCEQAIICGDIYDKNLKLVKTLKPLAELETDTDNILQLCLETIQASSSVLIFCPSKNWCENLSQQLSLAFYKIGNMDNNYGKVLRSEINGDRISEILEQLKYCPVGLDQVLYKVISFGVAFHHAGLTLDERDIIENAFRNGAIRILVATSTLSSGVNLPARRVIIRSPNFCGKPMDSLTYRQMIGRAGRMGKDTIGESFLVCQKNEHQTASDLMSGNISPVESCLEGSGKLKRAILEVISSGVASTKDDVKLFTDCTLLSITRLSEDSLENPIEEAVNFLVNNEFVKLHKTEDGRGKYMSTSLGKACLSSSIAPDEGLSLFTELEKARRCFVLDSELHIIYLVTPYSACNSWPKIDWMFYLDLWDKLSSAMKKVGELVGVKESYIVSATRGNIKTTTSKSLHQLMIHKRFFVALVLQDLVNEKPLTEVCNKYNCNRGMLQSLQQSASTFAGMVTSFSRQLGWSSIELLVSQFQDRMQFGVSRDLLDLMRLHYLNGKIARTLFNAGIETLIDLANSNCETIENIFYKAAPFESSKKRDEESHYDKKKRDNLRNVWIAGKEGLTEKQAAKLLLQGSRDYLQMEMGLKEAKWGAENENDKLETIISQQSHTSVDKTGNINEELSGSKLEGRVQSLENVETNKYSILRESSEPNNENTNISRECPKNINKSVDIVAELDESINTSLASLNLDESNQMEENAIVTNCKTTESSFKDESNPIENVGILEENMLIDDIDNNAKNKEDRSANTYKNIEEESSNTNIKVSKNMNMIEINTSDFLIAELDESLSMSLSSLNLDVSNEIEENSKNIESDSEDKTKELVSKLSQDLFGQADSTNNFSDINFTSIENNLGINKYVDLVQKPDDKQMSGFSGCKSPTALSVIKDKSDSDDNSFSLQLSDESFEKSLGVEVKQNSDEGSLCYSSDDSLLDGTPTKKSRILEKINTPSSYAVPRESSLYFDDSYKPACELNFSKINIISVTQHEELLNTFLKELKEQETFSFTVLCSKIAADRKIIGADIMGLENKTDSLNDSRVKIVGIGISWGDVNAYYLAMEDNHDSRKVLKALKYIFSDENIIVRMFNAKEQIKLLKTHFKMQFFCKIEDPKIADWLLDPDGKEKRLDTMISLYCKELIQIVHLIDESKELGGLYCDAKDPEALSRRASVEAILAWHLMVSLKKKLNKHMSNCSVQVQSSFPSIYELEMRTLLCLANLEISGMAVSRASLQDMIDLLKKQQAAIEKKAFSLAGRRFNFASSSDVAKAIGMYKGRKVSTKKQVLEQHEHPISDLVLQWRKINFTQTKMLIPLIRFCEKDRIYGNYTSHTATGRLTMQEPNVQMVNKDFTVMNPVTRESLVISCRSAFIAPDGCVLISADYCQLELRILTYLSNDKLLTIIMKEPGDIFRSIAAQWNHISEDMVDDITRSQTKQICYGIIYGMGSKSLSDQLSVSEDEAFHFMESFRNTYVGIKHFIKRTVDCCRKKGYVETITGRRRYLPHINHQDSSLKCQAERQAVNTTVQGSAADIVKHAMVLIEDKLNMLFKKSRHKPLLTLHLHDELIYEVPEKYLEKVISIVKDGMENSAFIFGQFPVKIKTGKNWGELKEHELL